MFTMNVTGGLTTLHHFAVSDGSFPDNELIQATDGAFYGAASSGGTAGWRRDLSCASRDVNA